MWLKHWALFKDTPLQPPFVPQANCAALPYLVKGAVKRGGLMRDIYQLIGLQWRALKGQGICRVVGPSAVCRRNSSWSGTHHYRAIKIQLVGGNGQNCCSSQLFSTVQSNCTPSPPQNTHTHPNYTLHSSCIHIYLKALECLVQGYSPLLEPTCTIAAVWWCLMSTHAPTSLCACEGCWVSVRVSHPWT